MKTLKLFFMALTTMCALTACDSDDDILLDASELPAPAQSFLNEHFAGLSVIRAEKDDSKNNAHYDVRLSDGSELEFDQAGEWTEVDCKTRAVPAAIVPEAIATYVATHYPTLLIVQIDRETYGYDIDLSNDLDLRFDHSGNFIGN